MSQEEFEALQTALAASMGQETEEIIINSDDEREALENEGPGLIGQMMNFMGVGGGGQNQEEDKGEEEKKD